MTNVKKACSECPFRKDALPGYLGDASYKPTVFLASIEHTPIPCHMTVLDWDDKKRVKRQCWTHTCIGSLQFMRNIAKMPIDPKYRKLRDEADRNTGIFSTRQDFIEHHVKR